MADLTAGVLAAGKGLRMQSDLPKVLHKALGRPLLGHVLAAVGDAGCNDVIVVVGPDAQEVRQAAGSDVRFVVQQTPRGTGDAFRCLLDAGDLSGTLLLTPGDVPLLAGDLLAAFVEAHRGAGAALTVLTFEPDAPGRYGRIVRSASGALEAIVEATDARGSQADIREVNSGVYCFEVEAVAPLAAGLATNNAQGEFYVTDLVAAAREAGLVVAAYRGEPAESFLGVNDRADLARVTDLLRRRVLQGLMADGVTVVDPSTTWVDCDVTVGRDTVLAPFTILSGGATVGQGCTVGPFAHVRAGSVLEDGAAVGNFTEVKASRLGEASRALHLSYLGDADLGRAVNVGAGTITANFDGRSKHKTTIADRASVGAGTIFVAPVAQGRDSTTAAGAVVVRDVEAGVTVAGVPARVLDGNAKPSPGGNDHD